MSETRKSTLARMQHLAAAALATHVACNHGCGGSGYAVVDPMPVPGRVFVAHSVVASASLTGSHVIVDVKHPTATPTGSALTYAANVDVRGGKLVSSTATADGMRFEVEPDPSRGAFYIELPLLGLDAGASVEAAVSWGTTPDGGRDVTVTMNDR